MVEVVVVTPCMEGFFTGKCVEHCVYITSLVPPNRSWHYGYVCRQGVIKMKLLSPGHPRETEMLGSG